MREKSKQHTQIIPLQLMDVAQEAVQDIMKKKGVLTLIHGHTHKEAIHHFNDGDKVKKRIVLNAWHNQGHLLVWEEHSLEPYFVNI